MITAAIVVGSIFLYFLIGALLARYDVPRQWALAHDVYQGQFDRYGRHYQPGEIDEKRKSLVRENSLWTLWCWPFRATAILMLNLLNFEQSPSKAEHREVQYRIKKLEKELGING